MSPAPRLGDRVLSRRGRYLGIVEDVSVSGMSVRMEGSRRWIGRRDLFSSTEGFVTLARNEEDLRATGD